MTLQAIRQRFLRLTRNIGTYNLEPEQVDVDALLDAAMARVAQHCFFYDPAITFTVSGNVATYSFDTDFGRRISKPYRVRLNGATLCDPWGLEGLWSVRDFEARFPNFIAESAGSPTIAVWYGSQIRLHTPPSSAFASTCTGYIAAEYVPGWKYQSSYYNTAGAAAASASPDLPIEFHDVIPELAAHLGSTAVADSDADWGIVGHRQKRVESQLQRLRQRNLAAYSSTPIRATNIERIWF